jgi:glycosyltransferase involved in cell wall biosynthesis
MIPERSVSIVTPSYNQGQFIRETLDSVRTQTYDQCEHIVVDGGSDNGTREILKECDESIDWISEPDEGQSDAINKGIDMASGDIIGWLNSDDVYFDTEVLSRVVKYFEQYDADVIYGDIALINADSEVLKFHRVPSFDYQKLLRYCFIEQPAVFFRDEVLAEERLDTDLEYVMDYEFWLRLAEIYEFRHVTDVLAADRNHAERKILDDRTEMQREGREMASEYGAPEGLDNGVGRVRDIVTSGLPRRIGAVQQTVSMQRNHPELAFDGEFPPLRKLLVNIARRNRTLL